MLLSIKKVICARLAQGLSTPESPDLGSCPACSDKCHGFQGDANFKINELKYAARGRAVPLFRSFVGDLDLANGCLKSAEMERFRMFRAKVLKIDSKSGATALCNDYRSLHSSVRRPLRRSISVVADTTWPV